MPKFRIPYESLDPLTIGASDDESKVYREELELEVPDANLLAAVKGEDEPPAVPTQRPAPAARAAHRAPDRAGPAARS